MSWPSQGMLVFALMSAIPPLIALLSGDGRGFVRSAPISILAVLLARFTYLVPAGIVLLIVSVVLASRQLTTGKLRLAARRMVTFGLPSLFVAYVLWLWLAFNWGPPRMFERAFVERSTQHVNQGMTDILNSQFPHGTNEAELKLALVGQGFEDANDSHPRCLLHQTSSMTSYGPCPPRTRQMKYEIQSLSIVCGPSHLFVNWSADDEGKLTRLQAFKTFVCW